MNPRNLLFALLICALPNHSEAGPLSLEAREIGSSSQTVRRWQLTVNNYIHDYYRSTTIRVFVRDFSRKMPGCDVTVYFVGRSLADDSLLIHDAKTLPIKFRGNLEVTCDFGSDKAKANVENYAVLGFARLSGIEPAGWVAVGTINDSVFAMSPSNGLVADTIRKGNFYSMVATYNNKHRKKSRQSAR